MDEPRNAAPAPTTAAPTTAAGAGHESSTAALGRYGEQLAAEHLTAVGMTVLARNWRCDRGELDLVLRDRDGTVVFCEVKTRAGSGFGAPAEAVGRVKVRRLRLLACRWLLEHPSGGAELRFDVVSIVWRRGEAARLTHLRSAF